MNLSEYQGLFNRGEPTRYPEECQRIARIAKEVGLFISSGQAEEIWQWHSDNSGAGWLGIAGEADEEIQAVLLTYCVFYSRMKGLTGENIHTAGNPGPPGPPPGYRLLESDDYVSPGDLWLRPYDNIWVESGTAHWGYGRCPISGEMGYRRRPAPGQSYARNIKLDKSRLGATIKV